MGALKNPHHSLPNCGPCSQRSPHIIPDCEIWVRRDCSKDSSHLLELNLVHSRIIIFGASWCRAETQPLRPSGRTSQILGLSQGKKYLLLNLSVAFQRFSLKMNDGNKVGNSLKENFAPARPKQLLLLQHKFIPDDAAKPLCKKLDIPSWVFRDFLTSELLVRKKGEEQLNMRRTALASWAGLVWNELAPGLPTTGEGDERVHPHPGLYP